MNEWQSFYPNFQPNQVLTSGHLNDLRRYVDEQNRLTRLRLSGMGIACGLTIRVVNDTGGLSIRIYEGYGISSEGYLIELNPGDPTLELDTDNQHYFKSYTRFRSYVDPANYWVAGPAGNEKQIPIYELLSQADAEALEQEGVNTAGEMPDLDEFDAFEDVINNCHQDMLDRFIVVLYLECADESLKSCTANDCDNTGQKTNITVRALLVNPADIVGQSQCGVSLPVVDLFTMLFQTNLDTMQVPRWVKGVRENGLTLDQITTYAEIRDGYLVAIEGTGGLDSRRELIADGLEAAFQQFGPFLGLLDGVDQVTPIGDDMDFNELLLRLRTDNIDEANVQYAYDFIKDLAKAYNEFIDLACDLHRDCFRLDYSFCKHLQLGRLWSDNTEFTRFQRNYWVGSGLSWNQDMRFAQCQIYFIRVLYMIREFVYMNTGTGFAAPAFSMRVTPGKVANSPLGELTIPFYYYDTGLGESRLYQAWNPVKGIKGKSNEALGYHASGYSPAPPDFVQNPLDYNIDEYNFLRIEGIIGRSYHTVTTYLEQLQLECSLPFSIKTVQLSGILQHEAVEYNCLFEDLHADFMLNKTCMIHNVMRLLDGFEFLSGFIGGPTDPEDGFDLGASIEQINLRAGDVLVILEGLTADTLLEFFLDDGYALATGDSVFESLRQAYLNLFNEIQRLLLFADYSRDKVLINDEWEFCRLSERVETLEIISKITNAINGFLNGCGLAKMHVLYDLFCDRWEAIQATHTSIFRNFAAKNPGLEHRGGVVKGGTFILVVDQLNDDPTDPSTDVLADFSLPYACCGCDKPDYPMDTLVTPYTRPYSIDALTEEIVVIPLENLLHVTEGNLNITDVILDLNGIESGSMVYYDPLYSGGPAIIIQTTSVLPTGSVGFEIDTIYYTPIDNNTGTKPFPTGVINVLIHERIERTPVAVDDYVSTLNQTAVIIDVLRNDCFNDHGNTVEYNVEPFTYWGMDGEPVFPGTQILTEAGGEVEVYYEGSGSYPQLRYTPNPGFQGVDTFWYALVHPTNPDIMSHARVVVSVIGCCCDLEPIECSTEDGVPMDITLPIESFDNMYDWRVYLLGPDGETRHYPGEPVGFPTNTGPDYIVVLNEDPTQDFPWSFNFQPDPGYTGKACFYYELVYKDDLQVCRSEVCVHVAEGECEPVIMTLPEDFYCESIADPLSDGGNRFTLVPAGGTLSVESAPTGFGAHNPFAVDGNGNWFFIPNTGGLILPIGNYVLRYELSNGQFATWNTQVVGRPEARFSIMQTAQTTDTVTFRFDIQLLTGHVERYQWEFGDNFNIAPDAIQSGNATFIEYTYDLTTVPTGTPPWKVSLTPIGAGCNGPTWSEDANPIVAAFVWVNESISGLPNAQTVKIAFSNYSTNNSDLIYRWIYDEPRGSTQERVQTSYIFNSDFDYTNVDSQNPADCLRTVTLIVEDTITGSTSSVSHVVELCNPNASGGSNSFSGGSGPVTSIANSGSTPTTRTITRFDLFGVTQNPRIVTRFFAVDQAGDNLSETFPADEAEVLQSYFGTGQVLVDPDEFVERAAKLFNEMDNLMQDPTALRGLLRGTRDASTGNLHLDALEGLAKGVDNFSTQRQSQYYLEIYSLAVNSLINTAAMRDSDLNPDSRLIEAFDMIRNHLQRFNIMTLYATKDDNHPINVAINGANIDARERPNLDAAIKRLRE